jgi:hypothetical protein
MLGNGIEHPVVGGSGGIHVDGLCRQVRVQLFHVLAVCKTRPLYQSR